MDPLDQRLTELGAAWRRSQPAPPDLDRLVARLDSRPRRDPRPWRLVLVLAGLVVLGAVAVAPGGGGILERFRGGLPPTATASPPPTPSGVAATPEPTSEAGDPARAGDLLDRYQRALVAGQWQTAFAMLAPASPTREAGSATYAAERAAYYASVAGRYVVGPASPVSDWTPYAPLVSGADRSRASLIEVVYPALSDNNAGYEQFIVAPDAGGVWWIWPVR